MYEIQAERVNGLEENLLVLHHLPEGDYFEEEMLAHNGVPGILSMRTLRVSGEKQRRYRIDGCCSLSESLLGRKLSGEDFRVLMSSLFRRVVAGKQYLLREESFVLVPEFVFVRVDTGETELVYCPEYEQSLTDQMRKLSDWLLEYLDSADAQAVYNGYAFHVLSHESGGNMQRILTVFGGGSVPGLPESPSSRKNEGAARGARAPAEASDIPEAVVVTRESVIPLGESVGHRHRLRAFLGGVSVLLGMLGALVWAMR